MDVSVEKAMRRINDKLAKEDTPFIEEAGQNQQAPDAVDLSPEN